MITKTISIKNHRDYSLTGSTWGSIFGLTDNNDKIHYTGQTETNAYVLRFPILFIEEIDDIGFLEPIIDDWKPFTMYNSGNTVSYIDDSYKCITSHTSGSEFNIIYWIQTPSGSTGQTVTYTGETRINEFRRYGKNINDSDLYNPTWNTNFEQVILTNNILKKITNERDKKSGLDNQKLYDYKFWVSGDTGTTINYSDIDSYNSIISYETSGLTKTNSIETEKIKLDYLIGVINKPKINIDVFIDRGSNSSFDKHMRLADIKTLSDLETYGNGYFKIKEI